MTEKNSEFDFEGSIVEGCQAGERCAQHRLYEQFAGKLYGLMVRMVGKQEAADLTQQTFLQVYRKIHQFSGKSKLATWLYRVAVNEALQHRRRRRNRPSQPLSFDPATDPNDVDRYEQRDALERALASVDPELRAIFLLREVERLSYSQIADVLEIPAGTVASRLNRARKQLRIELTRLD